MAGVSASRPIPRLLVAGGAILLLASVGWLIFGVAAQPAGAHRLAEAPHVAVGVIKDARPGQTLADMVALPETAWGKWDARGFLSARPGEVIWLRVRLRNPEAKPFQGVLADTSYFSDRVEVWWADGAGGWRHELSGDAVAGRVKPIWSRAAVFPVTVPAGGEQLGYFRVSDAYGAHVQPTWWRFTDFISTQARIVLAECLCYGALLALVFYNLVLWLRLRFADTGYYVLSAGASVTGNLLLNGGPALLGFPLGSPWHEMLLAAALALGGLAMLQFARTFLGTRELLPRADGWLRRWGLLVAAVALGVLVMPCLHTPAWLAAAALAGWSTDAICVAVAFMAWRRGAGHARYFLLAFVFLGVAVMLPIVSLLTGSILPGSALGLLVGRTLEMLLLSFAVAERFALTQQKLVEETEQRRLIEVTYADELEIEVKERTRELAEANADKDRMLAVIGHDLRSPLTGLMRAADAPAPDFPAEVSRTGRSLLLLIEDLVLWARLRAGTKQIAVHPASAVLAPAVALHRALAEHGGIALEVVAPADLRVGTDLVLAQTLVRNLLANALKFARASVTLRAEAAADGVCFTVGNDGPPLPREVAARFAAGVDEPLSATGGLGLRLCREICRALACRLEAGTGAGGRTEFSFTLPAASLV